MLDAPPLRLFRFSKLLNFISFRAAISHSLSFTERRARHAFDFILIFLAAFSMMFTFIGADITVYTSDAGRRNAIYEDAIPHYINARTPPKSQLFTATAYISLHISNVATIPLFPHLLFY